MIDGSGYTYYGAFGTKIDRAGSPFNHDYDHLSQTEVTRTGAGSGAVSPNRSDVRTYDKYDSFLKAREDAKNDVRHNGTPNQAVHTPAVAAFREDTTRYQRYTGAKNTPWSDDK